MISACEDNRSKAELTEGEKQYIAQISETETQDVVYAQAMNGAINNLTYIRVPERVEFDPEGDSFDVPSSIAKMKEDVEESLNQIKVFPNPSAGSITIEYYTEDIGRIDIINYLGQKIRTFELNNTAGKVELENLEMGVYTIYLHKNGVFKMHKKLIVIK